MRETKVIIEDFAIYHQFHSYCVEHTAKKHFMTRGCSITLLRYVYFCQHMRNNNENREKMLPFYYLLIDKNG